MDIVTDSINMPDNLILFDGICGLCNRSVDWILRRDRSHRFRFAPLQGETAEPLRTVTGAGLQSLVFIQGGNAYTKSSAVLRILWTLGGIRRLSALGWVLQPLIGDLIYDYVAKNRYRWYGQEAECRIPLPAERAYFLP